MHKRHCSEANDVYSFGFNADGSDADGGGDGDVSDDDGSGGDDDPAFLLMAFPTELQNVTDMADISV